MIRSLGPLAPGDRVALLSASGPPSARQVERGAALLRGWGLEPVVYPSASAAHPTSRWLAGPDAVRAADVTDAWCDPDIAGIFCVRGGYGSVRVLDLLDADRMRVARPKPLYGSSDVTALHGWLAAHLGVCTWFAPMIATADLLDDDEATASLHAALFEPWEGRSYRRDDAEVLVPGEASGPLVGGNLSLLAMTLGARTNPPSSREGAIVVLEDVGEDSYKFDGYLSQLLRAGWFDGAAAFVLGSWKDCVVAEVRDLVAELLVPLGVPTVWELGFGHGRGAPTLPLGVRAHLDARHADPVLTLLD